MEKLLKADITQIKKYTINKLQNKTATRGRNNTDKKLHKDETTHERYYTRKKIKM